MADDEMMLKMAANWKRTRKLTYDLVKVVPAELLNKKVGRPIYDTMAKQIYEMSEMQIDYSEALDGKEPDFSTEVKRNFTVISGRELTRMLKSADDYFYSVIENIDDWYSEDYDILGEEFSAYNIMEMMIAHETFHQGQFAAMGYLLDLKFPKSWEREWSLHFS